MSHASAPPMRPLAPAARAAERSPNEGSAEEVTEQCADGEESALALVEGDGQACAGGLGNEVRRRPEHDHAEHGREDRQQRPPAARPRSRQHHGLHGSAAHPSRHAYSPSNRNGAQAVEFGHSALTTMQRAFCACAVPCQQCRETTALHTATASAPAGLTGG